MPNHPGISRNERRLAVKREAVACATGKWGEWQRTELPCGGPGDGWLSEVRYVLANDLYAVLCRPIRTEIGDVVHCAIRTASNLEPPWRDKQRIKDECFGEGRVAVEVMPAAADVVDGADMYHMWIMPWGYGFPFGLHRR